MRGGTKAANQEFVVLTELLMVQLLKLDSIEAEGEAKVQRRIEVHAMQFSCGFSPFTFLSAFFLLFHLTSMNGSLLRDLQSEGMFSYESKKICQRNSLLTSYFLYKS